MSDSTPLKQPPLPTLFASTVARLRLLAVAIFLLGLWQAAGNLIDGWVEFDPTYLGYFLRMQLLRPTLAMLGAVLLWVSAGFLARRICRGLD